MKYRFLVLAFFMFLIGFSLMLFALALSVELYSLPDETLNIPVGMFQALGGCALCFLGCDLYDQYLLRSDRGV